MHDIPEMTVKDHHQLAIGLLACCFNHVPRQLQLAILEGCVTATKMGLHIDPTKLGKPVPLTAGTYHLFCADVTRQNAAHGTVMIIVHKDKGTEMVIAAEDGAESILPDKVRAMAEAIKERFGRQGESAVVE